MPLYAPILPYNLTTVARHRLLVYKARRNYKAPANKSHWWTSLIVTELFIHLFTINQLKVKALIIIAQMVQKYSFISTLIWFFTILSSCQYLQLGDEHKVCSCPKQKSGILSNILTGNTLSAFTDYFQKLWQFSEEKLMWQLTINTLNYLYLNLLSR